MEVVTRLNCDRFTHFPHPDWAGSSRIGGGSARASGWLAYHCVNDAHQAPLGVVFFTRGGGDTRVTRDTLDTLDTGVTGDTVGGAR